MKALHLLVAASAALLGVLLFASAPSAPRPKTAQGFVVANARVFDGDRLWPQASVRVAGGRIEAIAASMAVPPGYDTVDGRGRTLLPGLIDAHVHSWGEARRDALRFGVTTMLDMFSDPQGLPAAREQRASLAATHQADQWSAGLLATAAGGHGTQFGLAVPTLAAPDDAVAWVAARKAEGSDYIKLVREDLHAYSDTRRLPTLDEATARAVIGAAHAQGLRAVVHASGLAEARASLRDGADGLVHVFTDAVADADLLALAQRRGVFVVATLGIAAAMSGEGNSLGDDPQIAPYLAAGQRQTLAASFELGAARPDLLANARENVRRLHAAGVAILAGTDAPNPGTAHGASMHDELQQLVRAGLAPIDALQAATSRPAHAFGLADRGRIAAGLRADLVLVEGDPTADIAATRRIVTIWKNGHAIERAPEAVAPAPAWHAGALDYPAPAWRATTDQIAGGASRVEMSASAPGALHLQGELVAQAPYPWAGAMYSPGPGVMQPVDARGLRELVFQARGDGRDYAVMLFSGAQGGLPAAQRFTAPAGEWREVRLALAEFPGADLATLRAFAITAGPPAGAFALEIHGVEIR